MKNRINFTFNPKMSEETHNVFFYKYKNQLKDRVGLTYEVEKILKDLSIDNMDKKEDIASIVYELVSNIRAFTTTNLIGDLYLKTKNGINFGVNKDRTELTIIAYDNGIGIVSRLSNTSLSLMDIKEEKKLLKSAFNKHTSSIGKSSYGMGLYLVKKMVKKFKGEIIVRTGRLKYTIAKKKKISKKRFIQATQITVKIPI